MDEPLSNLGAKLRVQTRVQIAELQRSLETTTVYVTHDQGEAMTLGGRVVVLKDGALQQYGPPRELYEEPQNAFVAGFIGLPQMNLIRLPVEDGAVRLGGQTIKLPDQLVRAVGDGGGREVILGIRPEHMSVSDGDGDGIPGEVVLVESLGADSYIHASIEGTESTFVARAEGYHARPAETTVRLRIEPSRVYAFHPDTEERSKAAGRKAAETARVPGGAGGLGRELDARGQRALNARPHLAHLDLLAQPPVDVLVEVAGQRRAHGGRRQGGGVGQALRPGRSVQ